LLREWLKDGGQIDGGDYVDRIRDDLSGPDYQYDMLGRLQLERKEDMRKRGLASPDFADAFALTFSMPVAPPSGAFDEPDKTYANFDYDPLTKEIKRR
jgi:hypothetical protein